MRKRGCTERARIDLAFFLMGNAGKLEVVAGGGIDSIPRNCEVNMPDFIGKSSQIIVTNLYPF